MKTLDLIFKHKLWAVLKMEGVLNIDKNLDFYLFSNAKIEIINEIKTEEILEKYLERLILNNQPYKFEKKMFLYLKENLSHEKFHYIINKYPTTQLLLNWTKRNNEKVNNWELLNYLDKQVLENGTYLSYANQSKNNKIIEHAININKSEEYHISDTIKVNLLLSNNIKKEYKIKLLSKFITTVRENIMEYFFDAVKNEDDITAYWLINKFKKEINSYPQKMINPLRVPYNELMEKILKEPKNYQLIFEKDLTFSDSLFKNVIEYKQSNINIKNPLEETINQFENWKIKFNERDSNILFCTFLNYDNMDYFLTPNKVFNINIQTISIESILYRLLKAEKEDHINLEKFKLYIDKIYNKNFRYFERGSNLLFLDYVNAENMEYLLHHPLFIYNLDKLLHSMWTRDKDLGIDLAHKIDKSIVWKYIDSLNKEEKIKFELKYYSEKFTTQPKEKRMKI